MGAAVWGGGQDTGVGARTWACGRAGARVQTDCCPPPPHPWLACYSTPLLAANKPPLLPVAAHEGNADSHHPHERAHPHCAGQRQHRRHHRVAGVLLAVVCGWVGGELPRGVGGGGGRTCARATTGRPVFSHHAASHPPTHPPFPAPAQAIDPVGRELALRRGANILMPILTPTKYREHYTLYEGKQQQQQQRGWGGAWGGTCMGGDLHGVGGRGGGGGGA